MLFRVYEHYGNEDFFNIKNIITQKDSLNLSDNDDNDKEECFICYEYKTDNEFKPICLKLQTIYINSCSCNAVVHNCCLKLWFNKNQNCPICRKKMLIKNNTNTINYFIYILIIIKKTTIIIIRFISIALLVHISYGIFLFFKLKNDLIKN